MKAITDLVKSRVPFNGIGKLDRQKVCQNVVLRGLVRGKSTRGVSNLIRIARIIETFDKQDGFESKLKELAQFNLVSESAFHELDTAFAFAKDGYNVGFPIAKSRKGKPPDLVIEKGTQKLALECKNLVDPLKMRWCDSFESSLGIKTLDFLISENLNYGVQFSPFDVNRAFVNGEEVYDATHAAAKVADFLLPALKSVFSEKRFDQASSMTDGLILSISIRKEDPEVSYYGYDSGYLSKRIVANGLEPAARQLTKYSMEGLAVVHVSQIPDCNLLLPEISKFLSKTSEIVVGVLLTQHGSLLSGPAPSLLAVRNGISDGLWKEIESTVQQCWPGNRIRL